LAGETTLIDPVKAHIAAIRYVFYNCPMSKPVRLMKYFFARDALLVARELLGKQLVRLEGNDRITGIVCETEAYRGEEDLGCHCRAGRTPRTRVMYGPPGRSYVYLTYGMHWMFNIVVEEEGFPAAILIRGICVLEGTDIVRKRRSPQVAENWTNGPAKLCQSLNIDASMNDIDLCHPESVLYLEKHKPDRDISASVGPRVGLNTVPEPWKSVPWRFVTGAYGYRSPHKI
jgi:DNA-3-methyladenine glycosylase